jgi:hypothetical protein
MSTEELLMWILTELFVLVAVQGISEAPRGNPGLCKPDQQVTVRQEPEPEPVNCE